MIALLNPLRLYFTAIVAVVGLSLALAGCDYPKVSINGHTGVPLAVLDLAGRSAAEITLLGPDTVHIVHGDQLAITADGDPRARAALRFVLSDGKLGIGRQPDAVVGNGTATVTVTVPSVDHLIMAGSGTITADRLDGSAIGVTVAGSGQVIAKAIAAGQLDAEVLGSGGFTGSGQAAKLTLTLAGSGNADLARFKAGDATIDATGSGNGEFTSDGRVSGSLAGSGVITVHGRAHCDISVTGSGQVTCQP